MIYSTYRFTLDLQKHQSQQSIAVFQGDTAVRLYISLTDGGKPYVLPEGSFAIFSGKCANDEPLLHSCTICNNNTEIMYEFQGATSAVVGTVSCQCRLYGSNQRLITAPRFSIVVEERIVNDELEIEIPKGQLTALDTILLNETERIRNEFGGTDENGDPVIGRFNAEAQRVANEDVREDNENTRKQNESDRQAAYEERVAAFEGIATDLQDKFDETVGILEQKVTDHIQELEDYNAGVFSDISEAREEVQGNAKKVEDALAESWTFVEVEAKDNKYPLEVNQTYLIKHNNYGTAWTPKCKANIGNESKELASSPFNFDRYTDSMRFRFCGVAENTSMTAGVYPYVVWYEVNGERLQTNLSFGERGNIIVYIEKETTPNISVFKIREDAQIKGIKGDDGKSAYEVAVENGYNKSVEEWLKSLKGEDGGKGDSAYEIAVKNGYDKSESEWLKSLKGEQGDPGTVEVVNELGYSETDVVSQKTITENLDAKANTEDIFDVTEMPLYTNQLDNVSLTMSKMLNGSGECIDYPSAGMMSHTEFIPITNNSIIRMQDISMSTEVEGVRIITYDAKYQMLQDLRGDRIAGDNYYYTVLETNANGEITSVLLKNENNLAYFRISVRTTNVGKNPILTINEEIKTAMMSGGKLKSKIKVDYSQLDNIPSVTDTGIMYTLSHGKWHNSSLLNYSVDNMISNTTGIACETYFSVKDLTTDNTIKIISEIEDGCSLELGCCFYDENKVMLGNRSSWFVANMAIKDGAAYFRLCMRIKNSSGAYINGNVDNFPLDSMFIVRSADMAIALGDYRAEIDKNTEEIKVLKSINVDIDTHISVEDIADLKTLTISTDYNGYYHRKPFNIVHCTDLHSSAGNVKCFTNAIKLLEARAELDCMILSGDLVSSNFGDDNAPLEGEWDKITKDVIFTVGNHDVGNGKDVAKSGTDSQVYNRYYVNHLKNNFMYDANTTLKQYNTSNPSNNPMMNYYVDYSTYKLRIISMYQYNTNFETNASDSTQLRYTRANKAYKQSDINWLINTLSNTPEGYTVLFMTHEPENFGGKTNDWHALMLSSELTSQWKTEGILTKILTAYRKKTTISETITQSYGVVTTLNINADFSTSGGDFGAWIVGHTHDDYVGKTLNGELNIICKTCDNLHAQLSSSILRVEGTPNENTINIMSVDTEHRTITIKRIGAKFSRNGDWRNVTCLTY